MMARDERKEKKGKHPKRPPKRDRDPKPKPPVTTKERVDESGRFPSAMPADQQAGLQPQDYPDGSATFSTGPAEAVQYHYTREDLYNEQYAQEQLAAMQDKGAATVPGPGQIGVSYA